MNAYRVALILCRAVAIALWWSAGLHLLSVAVMMVGTQLGFNGGLTGFPVAISFGQPILATAVCLAIAATFLQVFAASLAASMTGAAAFEGESIAARHTLDKTELALARAGSGLFLLCFGAAHAIYPLLIGGYHFFSERLTSPVGSSFGFYSAVNSLLPPALQCLIGFVLAFRLGLRRLIKPAP